MVGVGVLERWPLMGQVLCSLGIMPLWVLSTLALDLWTLALCGVSLLLIVHQWSHVEQRRVVLLLILLGVVEALRLLAVAGWATLPLALGLIAYAWVGAGAWSGCRIRKPVVYGALALFLSIGVRLLGGMFVGGLTWVEQADWGLDVDPSQIETPADALELLMHGHQSADLVERLLESYSVSELMEAGMVPSSQELNSSQVIESARWLEVNGRGGEALRLLKQSLNDPNICWWAILFARTQGVAIPDCQAQADASSIQVVIGDPMHLIDNDIATQMEIDVTEELSLLTILIEGHVTTLRFDHGEPQDWSEEYGGFQIVGPISSGAHRIQLTWAGQAPISLKLLAQ